MSKLHPVTVSIARSVQPGYHRQFAAWAHAGQELAREWPGYLGSGWVRTSPESDEWHVMYRFSNIDTLKEWDHSHERKWWIDSCGDLMKMTRVEHRTGIEGWFDQPGDVSVTVPETVVPPRWKQAVGIFLPFFPLSLLANIFLRPLTEDWPLVLAVLLNVCVLTPVMTYFFLPLSTRLLRPWLQAPRKGHKAS
ncbi:MULTISPECIES: antibiotic biosynthesis monooxygenase [Arthrobacter]|uniref:antibiotic biosynthesis monooxygenase n=1 Tax=unclassified Arthrobacter TaxID=235627 RepID=UPI0024B9F21A|nr:antibiotic biosynthesis monooxygenase [Arthrobacter sp. H35-MC1]MDJ0315605.1 antibiotic biosynthesis monooxygenase [Arthrobacter sp. H35-MC1]